MKHHSFEAKVWIYPGETANWHFVNVPKELSEDLKKKHGANARGFGSLPVEVMIGATTWKTSIFPDKRSGTYLLPLKQQVRTKEKFGDKDTVSISVSVAV